MLLCVSVGGEVQPEPASGELRKHCERLKANDEQWESHKLSMQIHSLFGVWKQRLHQQLPHAHSIQFQAQIHRSSVRQSPPQPLRSPASREPHLLIHNPKQTHFPKFNL